MVSERNNEIKSSILHNWKYWSQATKIQDQMGIARFEMLARMVWFGTKYSPLKRGQIAIWPIPTFGP